MANPNQVNRLRSSDDQFATRAQDNSVAVVNQLATAVNKTPIGGAAPPAWIRPDFANNFTAGSGSYATSEMATAYHRDALKYVHAKVNAKAPAVGVLANTTIFTLNSGYRPLEALPFTTIDSGGGSALFVVLPSGAVTTAGALGAGVAIFGLFSFLAEQ